MYGINYQLNVFMLVPEQNGKISCKGDLHLE